MDDLPNGQAINLNDVRDDANVILVGAKQDKIKDIYNFVQTYYDIEDQYDYNPDGIWNDTIADEYEKMKEQKQMELLTQLALKYTEFQPKASINYRTVQSLVIASVNYVGTHIKCTNFYPLGCTFSNINGVAKDFSAQITITETITYNLISSLPLKDLVLFPISNNPINAMAIDEVNFTESQWILKLKAYLHNDGFNDTEVKNYPINTDNIEGQLYLYSLSQTCVFTVPDEKDDQVLRGVSLKVKYTDSFNIKDIPGIMVLEDEQTNQKVQKKQSKIKTIGKMIKNIYAFLAIPSSIKGTKRSFKHNTRKHIASKRISLLDNSNDESGGVSFNGHWNKVKSIDSLEIDTGNLPAVIESIPDVVAKVIEVKSESSVNLGITLEEKSVNKTQIISGNKPISYNGNIKKVTFNELVFTGPLAQMTLLLNGNPSLVTSDTVIVESGTSATVNDELNVKSLLELGSDSSISTSFVESNPTVKFNYRLNGRIPEIPSAINPSSIIFNYIGESAGVTDTVDYSNYLGLTNNRLTFSGENHKNMCEKWKNNAEFKSEYYSEFREKGSVVDLVCIEGTDSTILAINVTYEPKGIEELPSDYDDPPFTGEIDNNDQGSNEDPDKNNGLNGGAIAGIVIGCVVFVAIAAVLIWYFVFHKKKDAGTQSSVGENVEQQQEE